MTQRLMTLASAAAYCDMPVRNFRKHIGIAPVRLGSTELWDRHRLDAYIDGLQGAAGTKRPDRDAAIEKF